MGGDKFKPQYQRLLFVDREIREGRFPSCATIARKWEVSAKTIQRDVDYLKYEMKAPIEYDKARHGLYYGDKTWFLPAVLLNEGDILALLIGTQALAMYKGTPVADELKSIYSRLAQLLPEKISIAPELIFNRFSFHAAPSRPINADIWKTLIRGTLHQRATWIEYASPRAKQPKEHIIHPLHMANIEGDWYILAFDTRWEDIAQFAVSRIMKAELRAEVFSVPDGFDIDCVMKDRFGKFIHTDGGKSTTVRLLFAPSIAGQIAERDWHPQQKLKWHRDGALELSFAIVDIYDILPWVLSFGHQVTVISPVSARRLVIDEWSRALKHSATSKNKSGK